MKNKGYLVSALKIWVSALVIFCTIILLIILKLTMETDRYHLFFLIGIAAFSAILYYGYFFVYRRYIKIEKIFELYSEGYLAEDIFSGNLKMSPSQDNMLKILAEKLDKVKILNLSKKQAQYLALQNQINPHFLYNTLESIRSEALCAGVDGVAFMTEALATFFRYTISNIDHLVTLEDELSNIENYYVIQKYRFGDKLNLTIEYGEDLKILNLKLPKLILQPIVENAIYHGIEGKMGEGNLKIRIYCTGERLIIRISDDGMGMEQEKLEDLNNKLLMKKLEDITETNRDKRGGIAVLNVNNRIKLLLGEKYGITIQSKKNVGTDVEITLPIIKE